MKTLELTSMETVSIEPFRSHWFEMSANLSGIKSILFPEPGQMRSRKVVSRSNARSTGKYPSWKMGRMIHWESINELNAFRLLDCDPNVTSYSEQPCQIAYVLDGVERIHYPDILVTTTAGNSSGRSSSDPTLPNRRFSPELRFFRAPFRDGATSIEPIW